MVCFLKKVFKSSTGETTIICTKGSPRMSGVCVGEYEQVILVCTKYILHNLDPSEKKY